MKTTYAGLTVITSLLAIHCAAPADPTGDAVETGGKPTTHTQDSTSSAPSTPAPQQAKVIPANVPAPTPPAAKAPPPANTTQATGPGPGCKALSSCCSKITNSLEQIACFVAAGKSNELVCAGSLAVFSCSSQTSTTTTTTHGPSCSGLTSGALYCGNDGPGGDPDTLYRCSGSTVSIVRQCASGCQTNPGVDDACSTASSPAQSSGASCNGLSGDYCGTDWVGGSANTLYTCSNNQIATSKSCANGCVINPDASLNDTCATTPPASSSGAVSCTGLPNFDYCGSSVGGDANTLYTCSNGNLTKSAPCASGCTVAASAVSDYCTSASASSDACSGLPNGSYCGYNGPGGDFDTLYTCKSGKVTTNEFCDFGCSASDFGGDDFCD